MKPFVIGLALALVILAAGFLAPAFLQRTPGPSTLEALEHAELARRLLHAHDASLPLVEARSDVEQLKDADFGRLVERSQQEFDALSQGFNQRVRQAQASDRKNNMPEGDLRAVSTSSSGLKAAVSSLEKLLRGNRELLADAVKYARSATQADRHALGVGQVAGVVKLVEASGLLAEARQLRARLATEQSRAFVAAVEWATVRAKVDHYAGQDVSGIRRDLDADLNEIEAGLAQTQLQFDELTGAVAEREQELAGVRAELEQARTERLSLEELGFTVGSDESFQAYREKYLELSQRLRELQDREHLLALGGIQGGTVADDDLLGGEIEGGQTVIGLEELRRRLATAEDKLERYGRARKALGDEISLVGAVGDQAQTQERQYATRLDTLTSEVDQICRQMAELAQQAFEREDAALRAAREAATAFGNARSAVDRWISDARSLQQEKDEQRVNPRLKQIIGDDFAAGFATSAEAQAKTLLGRIHTERALGLAAYLDTLQRIGDLVPDSQFEAPEFPESLNTAREEAVSVLNEARELYQRLAQEGERRPNWPYLQASLAAVYHLLWQIDEFNAEQHRSSVIGELGKAIEGRQRSPHLPLQVALHHLLTGGAEPLPPPEPEETPEEPADEETPDEGE